MTGSMDSLRLDLVLIGQKLEAMKLSPARSGNISVRCDQGMLISASGLAVGELQPDDIVFVDESGRSEGDLSPSSEWRLHRDIYGVRPEFKAIVHVHSPAATTLACLRRDIPPIHYMILMAGGDTVRCGGYATFGTQALSDIAVAAMADRKACLLANHGLMVAGGSPEEAVRLAGEVEALATLYLKALAVGEPALLTTQDLSNAKEQFELLRYGRTGVREPATEYSKDIRF